MALIGMFRLLPMEVARALAKVVGTLAWLIDARHRRVAVGNLDLAYGDEMTTREKRSLVRRVFQHFAMVIPEAVKAPQLITEDTIGKYVEFGDTTATDEAIAQKGGALFVTGHLGNWELLGMYASLRGYEMTSIARPLDNPLLDRLTVSYRERYGQKIVPKDGALRAVVKVMKRGGLLGFVADQNARTDHVFVEFFGRPAATVGSIATLALRSGLPICFGFCVREDKRFRYRIISGEPIWPESSGDMEADILRITQAFTTRIESYVRQYPDQWLWLHRRWKTQPSPATDDSENTPE